MAGATVRSAIVVGGGPAGLAAAAELRRRGLSVQLLERSERAGGRAIGPPAGTDAAPMLLSTRDEASFGLLSTCPRAAALLPLRPCALAQVEAGRSVPVDRAGGAGRWLPPGLPWLERLRARRLPRILGRFRDLLDVAEPERAVRLDDRSVSALARLYVGPVARDRWAAPLVASRELADPDETSRVVFMLELSRRWGASLGTLRGPLSELAAALSDPADRTGVGASAITPAGDGLAVETNEGVFEADAVVVATPAAAARRICDQLLATPERRMLDDARVVPAICVTLELEGAPVRECTFTRVGPAEPGPLASLLVEPGAGEAPARAAAGTSLAWAVIRPDVARAHLGADDESVAKLAVLALESIHPGTERSVGGAQVHRFASALPAFPVGRFREIERFRRVQEDLRAGGRHLYFAGDHLVGAHLEGAIGSGLRAARELAADLA